MKVAKLKSFSLLELMVAIIISGLVVSTAFSVLLFTHQQFFKFTNVKSEIRNYFELSGLLNKDFEQAKKVIKLNEQEIEIQLMDKNIQYTINPDYILREVNTQSDTFFFTISNTEINTLNELIEEPLIDYMKLTIEDEGTDKILSFHKSYGAILHMEE